MTDNRNDRRSETRSGTEPERVASAQVGSRLREARRARGRSIDELARASGIEAAALAEMESAGAMPSLGVLWKIATGLGVPFADLLGDGGSTISVRRGLDSEVLRSSDGNLESRPLIPSGACRSVEAYALTLAPCRQHASDPHPRGTREIVVVLEGTLEVNIAERTYSLEPGDSMWFPADLPHVYVNSGEVPGRYHNIIVYDK